MLPQDGRHPAGPRAGAAAARTRVLPDRAACAGAELGRRPHPDAAVRDRHRGGAGRDAFGSLQGALDRRRQSHHLGENLLMADRRA